MKKMILCLCAAAAVLCFAASCGSRPVSNEGVTVSVDTMRSKSDEEIITEITGSWETSSEFLDGIRKDSKDITYKRYEFAGDGSGIYYAPDGSEQTLHWEITPKGGVDISYDDATEHYDYVNYDLTAAADTPEGELIVNIGKVGEFSEPVEK